MEYPQYRKYKNNKAYFKILSATTWEEKQVLGSKVLVHHFEVKIMPDRNFINDMLYDYAGSWDKITEEEYDSIN